MWFLPDRDVLATSGWFADPRLLPVDVWRSSASAYVGARLSGGPLAGGFLQASQTTLVVIGVSAVCQRLPGNSIRLACAVIRASAHAVPRAVLG